MSNCLDCNRNISNRGNRATRCKTCQKKHRDGVFKEKHKTEGIARRNGETNRWAKELMQLTSDDLMQLVTVYKERIKHAQKDADKKELRTRIKIITERYKRLQPNRGVSQSNVYGKDSICENCRFYNKRQLRCSLHTEDEMDKSIETGICVDYEYDKETKYNEAYYKQDVERNNNNDDNLGDYDYSQYRECDE